MEILINGAPMEENMQSLFLEYIGTIGMLARLTDSEDCHQAVASTLRRTIDRNFGLPLRFKAVKKVTGEEGRVVNISFPNYNEPQDLMGVVWEKDGKQGFSTNLFVDWIPYQSTGHHDASGTEVFFGDVLIFGGTAYVVSGSDHIELIKAEIVTDEGDEMLNMQYPWGSPVFGLKIKECVCIGNIYTPPAELERRAHEVRS